MHGEGVLMDDIKFKEEKIYKFIPEIGDLVEMTIPAQKLNASKLYWLNDKEKEITNIISKRLEEKRYELKKSHDDETLRCGFLGYDTKRFDFKKWEELFLEKGVLEKISRESGKKQKEILSFVLKQLDPVDPYRSMMRNLLEIKTTPDKRENDLHKVFHKILKAKGIKASAKDIWKELENNKRTYDVDGVIQEIADDGIYWISKAGVEQRLSTASFNKTISKLRGKSI